MLDISIALEYVFAVFIYTFFPMAQKPPQWGRASPLSRLYYHAQTHHSR